MHSGRFAVSAALVLRAGVLSWRRRNDDCVDPVLIWSICVYAAQLEMSKLQLVSWRAVSHKEMRSLRGKVAGRLTKYKTQRITKAVAPVL